jgi:hypothetical protein
MKAIKDMTRDEQIKALRELQSALGWYPVFCLCVDDIKDCIIERNADVGPDEAWAMPDDEAVHEACQYVARKFDSDAYTYAIEWAVERSVEEGESK